VVFKYADNYRSGPTIRFGVSELVYGTHYLTSDEEGWHNGTYSYHFYLPVRVRALRARRRQVGALGAQIGQP
jgi:hypothetical protein